MAKKKPNMDELSDMLHFEIDSGCDLTGHELSIKGKTVEMEFSQMEPFPEHKFRLYAAYRYGGQHSAVWHSASDNSMAQGRWTVFYLKRS